MIDGLLVKRKEPIIGSYDVNSAERV